MKIRFLCSIALGFSLFVVTEGRGLAQSAQEQPTTAQNLEARKWLNDGVKAYQRASTDEAIEDFKKATELDPLLINAQLYLATAYVSQYIPGAPSAQNVQYGELALEGYKKLLETDPNNLSAIDGAGSTLYLMAGQPFNVERMEESKAYYQKHIQIAPNDQEPYYWIGVIDGSIVFRSNRALRNDWIKKTSRGLEPSDAMPEEIRQEFAAKYGDVVPEGIQNLTKAMTLRTDYDDAMAYLNLLYREKADMERNPISRDDDLKTADDLVDQVKAIKARKMNSSQSPQQ
jgi:tetratricopeptide (TPR) repeat protein